MDKQENKKTRKRITAYLSSESNKMCEAGIKFTGCQGRSDFVEKAVCFYSGYLANQDVRCRPVYQRSDE